MSKMLIVALALAVSCVSAQTNHIWNLDAIPSCLKSRGGACGTTDLMAAFGSPSFQDTVTFAGTAGVQYNVGWNQVVFATDITIPDGISANIIVSNGAQLWAMGTLTIGAQAQVSNKAGGQVGVLALVVRGGWYSTSQDSIFGGGFQFASTSFGSSRYLFNMGGATCSLAGRHQALSVYTSGALNIDASAGATIASLNLNAGPYNLLAGGLTISVLTNTHQINDVTLNLAAGTTLAVSGPFSMSPALVNPTTNLIVAGSGRVNFLGDVTIPANMAITATQSSIVDITGLSHGSGTFAQQDSASAEVFLNGSGVDPSFSGNYDTVA